MGRLNTLFSHFIFICHDFCETLGIHGKMGISALNFFFFFLLFWHARQKIGLSFQHCFQKSGFYGWEFSLKMITFGSRSQKGDRREGSIRGTEIFFFSSICRKPSCKTNIMWRMKKTVKVYNRTPSNLYMCHSNEFHKIGNMEEERSGHPGPGHRAQRRPSSSG